ncbi:MAG: transporter substrate-binding domain-containing protein [Rhodobacteraceae bacterium]|nr:transporter substrate-binding domain-containing protein [Paracoccaceae bacterium]
MNRILAAAALCLATTPAFALNVCVEGAYPPFSETSPDGSIVGFDVDIAGALCAEIGEECTMTKTDWDGIIPALLEQKCDMIVASMSITPERQEVIDFTAKYYQSPAMFVAAADAELVDSAEGMAGKVVGVQRGTIHHDFMEKAYPDTELTLYASQDEAYLDLVSGRVDAVMGDSVAMDQGFLQTPDGEGFAFFGDPHADPAIHGEGAGIGVRKEDTELRDKLTAAIDAIRESGKYDEIATKYFDFNIYGDPVS